MDVRIEELHSSVDMVDPHGLLSPDVLKRIVDAVIVQLQGRAQQAKAVSGELDLKSVVQQQRSKGA
jgi:hypothetical protein